jgi:hypothetical protein
MQQDKVTFYFQRNILEKMPENIRNNICVAGGAVRDKLLDTEIKDFDIFVDSVQTEALIMKFLKEKGKEGNVNSQTANYTFEGKWLQVVRGKYFDMSTTATIDSFDFVHCCAQVTMKGFSCHPEFYRSIATKHIIVNVLTYPLNSLERLQKYVQKGYLACNGTLLALSKAINDMDRTIFTPDTSNPDQDNIELNSLMFYSDGTPRFMGVD